MKSPLLIILFGLLMTAFAPAEGPVDFEYGERPSRAVFDPYDVLDLTIKDRISTTLEKTFKENGLDVVVVVMKSIDNAPPEHVAKRFASAWCKGLVHAVVLHVPGRADSPWIVPSGELINRLKPEIVQQQVAEGVRRASLEPNESGKILAAVTEASDMLQFWTGNALIRSEQTTLQRAGIRQELKLRAQRWRISILIIVSTTAVILLGLSAMFFLVHKHGRRNFPNHTLVRRLGAPHSGGNHAVVVLGPQIISQSTPEAKFRPPDSL